MDTWILLKPNLKFFNRQSVTKIIENHYNFMKKSLKMLDLLKDTQNSPSPWFNVVPSLEKLWQTVVATNDQANSQPTLNTGAADASLTISSLIVSKIKKYLKRVF